MGIPRRDHWLGRDCPGPRPLAGGDAPGAAGLGAAAKHLGPEAGRGYRPDLSKRTVAKGELGCFPLHSLADERDLYALRELAETRIKEGGCQSFLSEPDLQGFLPAYMV